MYVVCNDACRCCNIMSQWQEIRITTQYWLHILLPPSLPSFFPPPLPSFLQCDVSIQFFLPSFIPSFIYLGFYVLISPSSFFCFSSIFFLYLYLPLLFFPSFLSIGFSVIIIIPFLLLFLASFFPPRPIIFFLPSIIPFHCFLSHYSPFSPFSSFIQLSPFSTPFFKSYHIYPLSLLSPYLSPYLSLSLSLSLLPSLFSLLPSLRLSKNIWES